ncbi:hypothetical protein D1224_08725 [Henriciella barbarensis]|uniref:Uncharacterized protein n=2 Tax=Henriciella barbarensis TaxID=86342 RepID=A0A399R4F7_9PROT|nr:hypothetical protein D1224_08725 [Henriciella barbarensis]
MVALGLALMVSCASREPIGNGALRTNAEIAKTEQQFVLLNILRRAAGEPAFFASLSNIDSRSRGDLLLGADVPANFVFDNADLLPGFTLQDSTPRYTVSQLNNAAFIRIMTRPLELGIVERLLAQSYDREFVLTLVVDEIGWSGLPIHNKSESFGPSFLRRRLRLLTALGLSTEPLLGDNTIIEDMSQEDVLGLIEEQGIATDRLSIVPDRKTKAFDIIGEPGGFRLCFRHPPVLDIEDLSDQESARVVDLTCRAWVVSQLGSANLGGRDLKRLDNEQKRRLLENVSTEIEARRRILEAVDSVERTSDDTVPLDRLIRGLRAQSESGEEDGVGEQELGRLEHFGELAVSIRSPYEILDFAAQIARRDLTGDTRERRRTLPDTAYESTAENCWTTPHACDQHILFRVHEGRSANSVPYRGRDWHIVDTLDDPDDRSIELLSMLMLLQSLATQSDDLADSPRVTVVP